MKTPTRQEVMLVVKVADRADMSNSDILTFLKTHSEENCDILRTSSKVVTSPKEIYLFLANF